MSVSVLHDALVHEMRDVLSAERQLTKALRKMSKKAQSEELRTAFETHLEETEGQIERLEQAFEIVGLSPRSHRCEAMSGLIEEGESVLEEVDGDEVLDAMLIASAQKVEHYEIATYGTLCAWAQQLGHDDLVQLFKQSLDEEKQTDEKLTMLAGQINHMAMAE